MTPLAWALLGYLTLQLCVTAFIGRFIKSDADFLLAGRSLGVGLAAMSIFATWFGAETVMASSGAVAAGGLAETRAEPFGYALCLVLMGLLLASKMRAAGYTTVADFYQQRFSKPTGMLAAFVMIPTSLVWGAAQIVAFASILAATFNISHEWALLVGTGFVIVYTSLSGLMGDVVTDNIEGGIVVLGLFILLCMVIAKVGGLGAAIDSIDPARLSLIKPDETWLTQIDQWAIAIVGTLVAQEIMSRMLATKDAKTARNSCLWATGLYLTVGLIPVSIGLVATDVIPMPEETDRFLPTLALHMMPPGLYVVFLGALISAILSTINSNLLAVSALTGHNLIMPFKKEMSDKAKLRMDRALVIIAGIGAYFVATAGDSIYELLTLSSSLGSAGLVVVVLFGLWSGLGTPRAAIATLITGVCMSLLGDLLLPWDYSYLKGVLACFTVFLGVSLAERHFLGRRVAF